MTLVLTRNDLASLLTPVDCLTHVEEAFRAYGEGRTVAPKNLAFHADAGTFHVKAAMSDRFVTKINANFPDNARRHALPTIQGIVVVMDLENGGALALLDSALITTLRTAAATAVATKLLARADASVMTVIGCGVLGRATLEALCQVRPIREVLACDLDHETAERFAREMSSCLGIAVSASESIDEAVAASCIVVTCTTARSPFLDVQHLHPGLFIAAAGADNPEKQELTPALLRESKVVADLLDQAAVMGDLHHALAAGVLHLEEVHGELADVLAGRIAGRERDDDVFVFDSTGTALQDVAVASLAFTRATERGVGLDIAFAS